jgi:hypothetical protein
MFLVVGSTALKFWFPENCREPKDLDVFTDENSANFQENAEIFWDDQLLEWFREDTYRHMTPDELYTLKVSHSFWELKNGSWDKHIADIIFLQNHGAKLIPELHSLLYRIWERKHGKKVMSLAQEEQEFFKDAVPRIYDHDSIHYSVAYSPGHPIYEEVLRDGATVDVDPKKMWGLAHDDLVMLFREEIYATALERLMIPKNYRFSRGRAYKWALRRTITSLTKGRSARFIVENIQEFINPDMDYVSHHLENKHYLILLKES